MIKYTKLNYTCYIMMIMITKRIDSFFCHPENKLLIHYKFALSNLSWHRTIADLSKTSVVQNLDSIVTRCFRRWLDLPISSTLSTLTLKKSKCRITLVLPSAIFIQCQTVIREWSFSILGTRAEDF